MDLKEDRPPSTPSASPTPSPQHNPEPSGGTGTFVFAVLCIAAIAAGAWWFQKHRAASAAPTGTAGSTPAMGGAPGGARPQMPPVPVVAGKVTVTNIPIFLDGLGTVQAFNSVTIRARVDGQLKKVLFREGEDVREGDKLAEIDPDPFRTLVEQAEAKKAQDEAQLANARIVFKRNEELLAQKILSQQDFDSQKFLVDQLVAAVKTDQAAIDSAKVQLAYTDITAPLSGRTGLRLVDQGNIVRATDANGIVVITQLKPISVSFTLPEQSLAEIQKQQQTGKPLTVLAVGRDNATLLASGTLAVIDNQIDTTTATIRLKATFPNEDLRLWPGQFINARLLLATRTNGIAVPATVVQRGPDGTYAFVVNEEDSTVKIRPIKVGPVEGGLALIEKGLEPGETVVVDGQYKLQPGSKILTGPPGGGAQNADGKPRGGKPRGQPSGDEKPRSGKPGGEGKPADRKPPGAGGPDARPKRP